MRRFRHAAADGDDADDDDGGGWGGVDGNDDDASAGGNGGEGVVARVRLGGELAPGTQPHRRLPRRRRARCY